MKITLKHFSALLALLVITMIARADSPPRFFYQIARSGTNVILSWSATGFTLQSATNLASPQWFLVSGQNTVTNPISNTQLFYRLSQ